MTPANTTRIRVDVGDCDFLIAAIDYFLADLTDRELMASGDAVLDLRNRINDARHRARTLRGPVFLDDATDGELADVVRLPVVRPAALRVLAHPDHPTGGGAA